MNNNYREELKNDLIKTLLEKGVGRSFSFKGEFVTFS